MFKCFLEVYKCFFILNKKKTVIFAYFQRGDTIDQFISEVVTNQQLHPQRVHIRWQTQKLSE